MANYIIHVIPNTLTCCNLFFGAAASYFAFQGHYSYALVCIIVSAIFDFFDGMAARVLNAHSPIGKDLDSLADDISFGLAPSAVTFSLMSEMVYSSPFLETVLPFAAFLIAVFSGLRLAKFNNDVRQTTSFIGLPVPANALFWASLAVAVHDLIITNVSPYILIVVILISCYLLVSEIPMFSLKFKSLKWADNKVRFLFLLICIVLLAVLRIGGITAIILWYILLSLFTQKKA